MYQCYSPWQWVWGVSECLRVSVLRGSPDSRPQNFPPPSASLSSGVSPLDWAHTAWRDIFSSDLIPSIRYVLMSGVEIDKAGHTYWCDISSCLHTWPAREGSQVGRPRPRLGREVNPLTLLWPVRRAGGTGAKSSWNLERNKYFLCIMSIVTWERSVWCVQSAGITFTWQQSRTGSGQFLHYLVLLSSGEPTQILHSCCSYHFPAVRPQ